MKKIRFWLCVLALAVLAMPIAIAQFFDLPPLPEPSEYGNILITRQAATSSQLPVSFSHWTHRQHHTCRVCHFELGFAMTTNATEITEQSNLDGEYCGACHNAETSFAHTPDNCTKCHDGGKDQSGRRFSELQSFPKARFGNEIDWVQALDLGLIRPTPSILEKDYQAVAYQKELDIPADWALIPPAIFPHDKHMQWLDCGDCHPGIFNVKVKSTMHFQMRYILEGKFCGACHLSVAFPLNDCRRCHPGMRK